MKKVICFLSLISTLTACSERTEILNSIDGSWAVETIVYTKGVRPDSVSTPIQTSIVFDKCSKSSNQGGPGNCTGRYTVGSRSYEFYYQVMEDKKFSIGIRGQADRSFDWTSFEEIARQYSVISVRDGVLIFEGDSPKNGYKTVRFTTRK